MDDLRGFLIRTDGRCEECTVRRENELENLYAALECSLIDIVCRVIGGKTYNIVCDDEGLLREAPVLTAATLKGEPVLFGNLLIARNDNEGNLTSLTDEDMRIVEHALVRMPAKHSPAIADRVLLCEYR